MYEKKEIQKLIDSLDIVEVISEYVNLKKSGSGYKGLSPFKDERTPSFSVDPIKNIFFDFSSGVGGNVIKFYQLINDVSFPQAMEELSQKYNIPLRKSNFGNNYEVSQDKYKEYYEILNSAYEFFKNAIEENDKALKYMKERGFLPEDIKKFEIGFSLNEKDELFKYLIKKNFSEEKILELGLVKRNETGAVYDTFRNRIMFPIYNPQNKIVGFGGRIIEKDTDLPKYLNSADSVVFKKGRELFGLKNRGEAIKRKGFAMLMEGYLDVLTVKKYGFETAVASLGTAFTEEQANLLKKYTKNIIIAYDNDEAGKNAIIRAGYILKKLNFDIKCLRITENVKDPDEFLRKYGKRKFVETLKKSVDFYDFLFQEFTKTLNIDEIASKRILVEKFKPFFETFENELDKELYIQKLSHEIGIEEKYLRQEFKNNKDFNNKNKKGNSYGTKSNYEIKVQYKKDKKDFYDDLEEQTIMYCIKYFDLEKEKTQMLTKKDLTNKFYSELFSKLKGINFDVANVSQMNKFDLTEEQKEKIFSLKISADREIEDEESYFKEIFKSWLRRDIKNIRKNMTREEKYKLKKEVEIELSKEFHTLEELKKIYKKFEEIRRPG
ncbi:DNA primase [Leptotrichia sp. oral taxon 847]|uniref:DNA primase n=1 Tax=Leptotrichia sp. oral taxon 847 TaxID=1785996 RepID=UPI00076819FC|nr:DNA primase [Leptotrichia sp. oral taxon 847]AMD95509.1 DNA primase [Leptotrichia sp. oral taxon 847]